MQHATTAAAAPPTATTTKGRHIHTIGIFFKRGKHTHIIKITNQTTHFIMPAREIQTDSYLKEKKKERARDDQKLLILLHFFPYV